MATVIIWPLPLAQDYPLFRAAQNFVRASAFLDQVALLTGGQRATVAGASALSTVPVWVQGAGSFWLGWDPNDITLHNSNTSDLNAYTLAWYRLLSTGYRYQGPDQPALELVDEFFHGLPIQVWHRRWESISARAYSYMPGTQDDTAIRFCAATYLAAWACSIRDDPAVTTDATTLYAPFESLIPFASLPSAP